MANPAEVRLGIKTRAEIFSQPDTFQRAYEIIEGRRQELVGILRRFPRVIFFGSGLSYNTAEIARDTHMALTGWDAFAVSAGELFGSDAEEVPQVDGKTLLVPISRTGTTTEVIFATEALHDRNPHSHVLGITANPDSELARRYPDSLVISPPDESIVETRSFTTMLEVAHGLSAIASGRYSKYERSLAQTPDSAYHILQTVDRKMQRLAQDDAHLIFFLGRGMRHGVARAARVTVMEMSLTETMEDKTMDGPHDTFTLVGDNTQVVVFLSDGDAAQRELDVARQAQKQGARTVVIAERPLAGLQDEFAQLGPIFLGTNVDQRVRNPLLHIPAQLLGYHRAIYKGLNPDEPLHLQPVVKYETK